MKSKIILDRFNFIEFITWLLILLLIVINSSSFNESLFSISIVFVYFNIMLSFLSSSILMSIPVILIQVTGTIRFILIPYVMKQEGIGAFSNDLGMMRLLLILEMLGTFLGLLIYNKRVRGSQGYGEYGTEESEQHREIKVNTKIGFSAIILLIVGAVVVITNQSLLTRYFSFSRVYSSGSTSVSGLLSLIASAFFLMVFIIAIQTINNITHIGTFPKVLISIFLSILFVNGTSVTEGNVSRWTMMISTFIAFLYISKLYPSYRRSLAILLIGVGLFTVTFGTMMKFGETHKGYATFENTLDSILSYRSLNSYFSGPGNMANGIGMISSLPKGIGNTCIRLISDLFANFPLLNHYISNRSMQLNTFFNVQIYGSLNARDQIVPYSIQLYSYIGFLFFIPHALLINMAMKMYDKLRNEKDFLAIYCLAYLSVWPCLYNCISLTIMMQNLWIHVLPVYFVYFFNRRRYSMPL